MKKIKKYCGWFHTYKHYILVFSAILATGLVFTSKQIFAADLLERAFRQSKQYDQVINLGNNKNAVGNELFQAGTNIGGVNQNLGQGCFVNGTLVEGYSTQEDCAAIGGDMNISVLNISTQDPLYVRITKFILRLTIILAITMVLFNGVKYVASAGNDGKAGEARKALINIGIGILIAMFSLAIVYFISSITSGTLLNILG
ncbi:MAG TPA: hypothetical protein PKD96_00270 [Candidatus Absconditabacterales bacterium]|nr:hypothetical protein [Candidatus Absconditabacterales bacterium]HMT26714.1 hypothetical protein [Candidatus Absconditabacterales bacterium]